MARYTAFIQQGTPLGYVKEISGKRIDAINRAILATGKAWEGLELPKRIIPGRVFVARFDGWTIEIHKESQG